MSPSQSARLDVASLISHRFPFDRAEEAYELVMNGTEPHLGVVLEYGGAGEVADDSPRMTLSNASAGGERAMRVRRHRGRELRQDDDSAGAQGRPSRASAHSGHGPRRLVVRNRSEAGILPCSTEIRDILENSEISSVVVTTPHSTHASMVCNALAAGKNVFVEKPLALSREELQTVIEARNSSSVFFMVGFNRRFAPHVQEARNFLKSRTGRSMIFIRINAGQLPPESWQRELGGTGSHPWRALPLCRPGDVSRG